jgi:hypothetical protein
MSGPVQEKCVRDPSVSSMLKLGRRWGHCVFRCPETDWRRDLGVHFGTMGEFLNR